MLRSRLILILLFVICFSLASYLESSQTRRETTEKRSAGLMVLLLGDVRKMLANEIYTKADAYFHRGEYPSIFETEMAEDENHMTGDGPEHDEHGRAEHEEHEEESTRRDWIERFGRHFYATDHMHLEKGKEREILPWLRLSVELDPTKVDAYAATAYWLRRRLGKIDEAEQILREGLRNNPGSADLLNELGRLSLEDRKDNNRARNVWQVALQRWREVEAPKQDPDILLLDQILGGLVQVELKESRTNEAIAYLKQLKDFSPNPTSIQQQIDRLQNAGGAVNQQN